MTPSTLKHILVAADNEYRATWGMFVRKYGKQRAAVMMEAIKAAMIAAGQGRTREQGRDILVDVAAAVSRIHTISQSNE